MEKILKKTVATIGITSLIVGIIPAGQASAAFSYDHTFRQPWIGCAKTEEPARVVTGNAYVSPSVNATQTTYTLILPDSEQVKVVSNYIKTTSTGRENFIYNSGHGGSGETYKLNYFPSNAKFSTYNVYGKWQP